MHPTLERLLAAAPIITDGAWGTELQALGLPAGECPDAWNLTHPDEVRCIARDYVDAGSRVILTNTFRGNSIALAGHGLADRLLAINSAGVRLSREAAGSRAMVFASIGPTGKLLMAGDATEEALRGAFSEQAEILAAAGADAIVVETMSDLEEARLAVAAAPATGLPVVASMVFDSGKERDRTMMGTTVEEMAAGLAAAGADVIGANCGLGAEGCIPIARRLKAATRLPVWMKPNAGLPVMTGGKATYRTTPEEFAAQAALLADAGVAFLGGCCGPSPAFIAALARSFR